MRTEIEIIEVHASHGGVQEVYRHASTQLRCDMVFSVFTPYKNAWLKRLAASMPGVMAVLEPADARAAVRAWAEAGLAGYR